MRSTSDAALAQDKCRTETWVHKPWSIRRVRVWIHRTNLFNPWIHKGVCLNPQTLKHSQQGEHSKRKQSSQKGITSNCVSKCYNGGDLYRPQKVKGRPSDKTHEKITQKYWKYNPDSMHVSETEVTKEKENLLGLVRPLQKDICSFQGMS